jgi:NAD(P)-dependent dehydrogenase (short-subunit alcohol dehydrogenase family)
MTHPSRTAIILGATADIGRHLAERLSSDNWNVVGIGRTALRLQELERIPNLKAYQCSIADGDDVERLAGEMRAAGYQWDLLVSCVGTTEPIGKFFEIDFDAWERSIVVNFTAQLRVLHALWPLRRPERIVDVMLLAGGGTNGTFPNYSAYCVTKIALIKMCELIHDEASDANAFIIGPGFTRTRIHEETLRAGPIAAGRSYDKVRAYLEEQGTSFDDIYEHMRWCMLRGRQVAGGRNFSTVHDRWRDGGEELANQLYDDPDAFRLRRRQP